MADITFTTNTYAGEAAAGYISLALLGGDTLDRQLITIMPNVKKSLKIRPISQAVAIQDPGCDFVAAGNDVVIDERSLDPVEMEVNEEMCFADLRQSWEAQQLRPGADNNYEPTLDLANFLIDNKVEKTANIVDSLIWRGKAGTPEAAGLTAAFDGFITKFVADANVIDVTGTAASITSANVIAELTKIYNLQPEQLRRAADWTWYVHPNFIWAYQLALAAAATGAGAHYLTDRPMNFLGHELVPVNYMPVDTAVVARRSNLFFGTDLLSDINQVRTVDMRETTADDKVRYRSRFMIDVEYGFGQEVVLYQPNIP